MRSHLESIQHSVSSSFIYLNIIQHKYVIDRYNTYSILCNISSTMPAKLLQLCLTLCDPIASQALLSMRFSRQEYWNELPCPSSGNLPDPGVEPMSHVSCIGRQVLHHSASYPGSPNIIQADTQIQVHCPEIQQGLKTLPTKVWMKNAVLHIRKQRTSSHCRTQKRKEQHSGPRELRCISEE